MRTVLSLNEGWLFAKPGAAQETVTLPHTWNAVDGQDGGGDYFRGMCRYSRTLKKEELPAGDRVYLEIPAANSSADVYVNGVKLMHHDGGYSIFRTDITDAVAGKEESLLEIDVDNSANDYVYPQMADFTFYGGLYRGASLIGVSASHISLDDWGGPGVKVTPVINGKDAKVTVEASLTNAKPGQTVRVTLLDAAGNAVDTVSVGADAPSAEASIADVHLWNGRKDPYLYTAVTELLEGDRVLDAVKARLGCRTYEIHPDKGFILNGELYPLHGVSRHQDRKGIGNALLPEHHKQDMDLICEVGATTIRLAHYEHSQCFYDLCDERGMVVWAEIPYISRHLPKGRENTLTQMRELITQNYNHPSIVVWGLSNEITMGGDSDPDLLENHRLLNDLCHELDKTRKTTEAVVSMCDIHSPYLDIPDVVSYNHYFGWYGGNTAMNGPWFDKFHEAHPDLPVGISEYGCEALNWHTSNPTQGDYTEEYQAYYHEELIKQIDARPYLWATHVWNMFDFGADSRAEGGENGQNHKGLVTFDRSYKKDSFYAYKAWLSDEPFVHLCGKRYVDRVEAVTKVTVYSNQPEVELFVNGKSLGKKSGKWFFYFDVPNEGESTLEALAGEYRDESTIRKVDTFNEDYRLKETGTLLTWYEITAPEGYFSLNDNVGEIMKNPEGLLVMTGAFKKLTAGLGDKTKGMGEGFGKGMMDMLNGFTVIRMINLMGTAGNKSVKKEDLIELNQQLNKIRKH